MAKSTLDIVIQLVKQGGGDKDTVRGLLDVKRSLATVIGVVGGVTAAFAAVDRVMDATVGKFTAYADGVRRSSAALSLTAEQTSRLTQVLDDFGVEIGGVEKALFTARKNGIDITVEGLAQMADQYAALATPQEKAKFLQDAFAKGGAEMAVVLEGGRAKIEEYNASIASGFIMTEESIAKAEEYRLAVDALNDAKAAAAITIGQEFTPAVTNALTYVRYSVELTRRQQMALTYLEDALKDGRISIDQYNAGLDKANISTEWAPRLLDSATSSYIAMARAAEQAANSEEALAAASAAQAEANEYNSAKFDFMIKAAENYAETQAEIASLETQIAEKRAQGYTATGEGTVLGGLIEQLDAAKAKSAEFANQMILDMMKVKISADGVITPEEIDAFFDLAEGMGLISEQAAAAAAALFLQADAATAAALAPNDFSYTYHYNVEYSGSGRPGGAPGTSAVARAAGGDLGDVTVVGERGWEAVLRRDDGSYVVVPHTMSEWMSEHGLLDVSAAFAAGGVFGSNSARGRVGGGTSSSGRSRGRFGSGSGSGSGAGKASGAFGSGSGSGSQDTGGNADESTVEQAADTGAEAAVDVVAPVVEATVEKFNSATNQNTDQVARQTAAIQQSNAAVVTAMQAVRAAVERLPEKLAAEIQKNG